MIRLKLTDYYNGRYKYLNKMYRKKTITIDSGLTVLVGCNGSGKTTLMKQFKDYCEEKEIPVVYKNMEGIESELKATSTLHSNFEKLSIVMSSSEGEVLREGIGQTITSCGTFIAKIVKEDHDKIMILLDATDSGSSIDNILDLKDSIYFMIEDILSNNVEPYIIISANAYEVANGENCFLVNEGKYHRFKDYEEYKKYILKTAEYKYNRYDTEEDKES